MIASSLVQPWAGGAPAYQLALLAVVLALALALGVWGARRLVQAPVHLGAAHVALALALVPVYFAAFALTVESTRIVEGLLQ